MSRERVRREEDLILRTGTTSQVGQALYTKSYVEVLAIWRLKFSVRRAVAVASIGWMVLLGPGGWTCDTPPTLIVFGLRCLGCGIIARLLVLDWKCNFFNSSFLFLINFKVFFRFVNFHIEASQF